MRSTTTTRFRKAYKALPTDIQERAREAFERFQVDPEHPGLRLKKVHQSRPVYSVRVSRSHRALAVRHGDEWVWFWIGSHTDYERLLDAL